MALRLSSKLIITFLIAAMLSCSIASETKECESFLKESLQNQMTTEFRFYHLLPEKWRGYSLEFFFDHSIETFKAETNMTYEPISVKNVTGKHWILSVQKLRPMNVKRVEFKAKYTYSNGSEAKVTGIILNGKDILCGQGKTIVFTTYTVNKTTTGNHPCNVIIKSYEHESTLTIEKNFVSSRIGVVIDFFLETDADSFQVASEYIGKTLGQRHFCMINSGIITSSGQPIKASFNVKHHKKPPPTVIAIVINDVVVCGFAPVIENINKKSVKEKIYSTSKEEIEKLNYTELKTNAVTITSGISMILTVVVCLVAYKLSKIPKVLTHDHIYSLPNKQ